jgi:hypothetical protein
LIVPSQPPDARTFPSGLKATLYAREVWLGWPTKAFARRSAAAGCALQEAATAGVKKSTA